MLLWLIIIIITRNNYNNIILSNKLICNNNYFVPYTNEEIRIDVRTEQYFRWDLLLRIDITDLIKNHFLIYWYFPHMNILLEPSTKRQRDISVTKKLCHECAVLYIIPRVKWVEQGALLAVKYIQLYLTMKFQGMLLPRKAPKRRQFWY